jgi:MYXO-CTERM domain-containing protein
VLDGPDGLGDEDEDGIIDALDPDHTDGPVMDPDGDGLSNAEEETAGTDPLVADTDGDGLSDGDEVNTHGTDPLAVDSDGDGYNDDQEVAEGWDPLDEFSPHEAGCGETGSSMAGGSAGFIGLLLLGLVAVIRRRE